ncbi:MAG: hypothetical protein VKQ33_02250 [Candidatus Sericytochromatia bacterium]|nr:hypothetical protein [Candidatus Sericytochromatia bacterium]
MRAKKTHPNHVKTRLFGEVERALRGGADGILFSLPAPGCGQAGGGRRKQVVAMHVIGDRLYFFDPGRNPELSYAAECGVAGEAVADYPGMRYEGRGLHSLPLGYLRALFLDGKGFALVPLAHRLALAG